MTTAMDKLNAVNDVVIRERAGERGFRFIETYGGIRGISFCLGRLFRADNVASLIIYHKGSEISASLNADQLRALAHVLTDFAEEMT